MKGDPRAALHALRAEVQKLDPALPIYGARTLTEHMGTSLFPARMAAITLGSFGVLALLLAAVGIYGVMSHMVAGRMREIGLRMAIGAQRADVRRLILRQGMMLAAIGSIVGLAIAFGGAQLLKTMLYGVSPSDPDHVFARRLPLVRRGAFRLLDSGAPRHARRSDGGAARGVRRCNRSARTLDRGIGLGWRLFVLGFTGLWS